MTRLHIVYFPDLQGERPRGENIAMNFDVGVERHVSEDLQFRVTLISKFEEQTQEKKPLGFQIESTIVGIVRVSEESAPEKAQQQAEIHGATMLYGTLRGLLMSATGSFPAGPMMLKMLTAGELLGIKPQPPDSTAEIVATATAHRSRARQAPAEEGIASAQRVFAKVLEKADPKGVKK